MLWYQVVVLATLLVGLGILLVNMAVVPRLLDYRLDGGSGVPRVAVLVPMRNEEGNVEACLGALLAQDYPAFEVWLYDDASTDRTGDIAARMARENRRLHVATGTGDPPPGWLGKANACHRLYMAIRQVSEPDYILFTDADVRHEPSLLSHGVATAKATQAGLLTIFPRQITLTWAERIAAPLIMHFAAYAGLPLPLAFSVRTGPAFSAANGQFMLFTREAYEACGGHTAVRANILEDVGLGRAVKGAGYRTILADGGPLIRTRMYTGAAEVWNGYSKNVYTFFGSPFFLLLAVAVFFALYVAPPLFALYGLASGRLSAEWVYLPLAQYGVAVLIRVILAVRFRYRVFDAFLHPVAMLYLLAILLNSMVLSLRGKTAWKGRVGVPVGDDRP